MEEAPTITTEENSSDGVCSSNNDYNNKSKTSSCCFSTNWGIVHGSLDDSITFEASQSPIDSDDGLNSTPKSPLVLKPLSDDSAPCEIKLYFPKKHEIRQVYVRSTARVYEIYYAHVPDSNSEYLCTVRCSVAVREDELLLHANDTDETVFAHKEGLDGELPEKKSTSETNISTNEDDWVEVGNPELPLRDIGMNFSPKDVTVNGKSFPDFYEATAEISDADPCITIVLRLLSLEDKGCIYIDEVYVYADPIETTNDLENQSVQSLHGGNSAGSSLMAMFVPTLLHLTRSRVGLSQDRNNSSTMVEKNHTDKGAIKEESTGNLNGIPQVKSKVVDRQDVKSQEVSRVTAEVAQSQSPLQVPDKEKQDSTVGNGDSHIVRVMEQLISRVSRIEDLCLRFEENMLKPINRMEARLQRVEDQLEIITKNSLHSGFPSCTRFSAPAFSSLNSSSSSFYDDGCATTPCVQSEIEERDTTFVDISKSSDEHPKSTRAQCFPSLVVTAPEFSCGEEDEENDVMELKNSPQVQTKQPLSIDNALAAALAGFSSLTTSEPLKSSVAEVESTRKEIGNDNPSKYSQSPAFAASEYKNGESASAKLCTYTQSLKVTAPEFLYEDDSDDKQGSPRSVNGNLVLPYDSCTTNGSMASVEVESQVTKFSEFKEITKADKVPEQFHEGQTDFNSLGTTINHPSSQAVDEFIKDDCQASEETRAGESSSSGGTVSILERFKILSQLLAKAEGGTETREQSGPCLSDVEKASDYDLPVKVFKSSHASPLDFETPILEVTFSSSENSSSNLPLEDLLTNTEIKFGTSLSQKSDGVMTTEPCDFSPGSVQDDKRMDMRTKNHLLVDIGSYDACLSSEVAGKPQDPQQEVFVSLI